MRTLYAPIEPYARHEMARGLHRVYVEECGNAGGLPVVFLHGGPGSGCKPDHRRFFDPGRYRIVLVDQRGAGRSTPQGERTDNTTQSLLEDLEAIRQQLAIERWLLFGGSWGAALALLYAQQYRQHVNGLILRGSFLAREKDLRWFIADGVPRIYAEQWLRLLSAVPEAERGDILGAIDRQLLGTDQLAQRRMAREWALWTNCVALGEEFDAGATGEHVPAHVLNQARIELHYALNRYFIAEGETLAHCERLRELPIILIHGRRDLVCPLEAAFTLQGRLPHAQLRVLRNAGHIAAGEEMLDALVVATDEMADRLRPVV
jgi:proline iminopeptidase